MQIRPGVTLLQAIAKASEARPVPFSERLSHLQGGQVPGRIPDVPPPTGSASVAQAKELASAPNAGQASKPRGSLLNIVV